MDRRLDFTYDKENYAGLPEYIQQLKKDGMHYVIILVKLTTSLIFSQFMLRIYVVPVTEISRHQSIYAVEMGTPSFSLAISFI